LAEQESLAARRSAALESLIADESDERDGGTVNVDGSQLAAAIRQVRVAADVDPASQLSGVLLDFAAGTVDVVATNRYWMAVRTLPTSPVDDVRAVVSLPDAVRLCGLLERHDRVALDLNGDGIAVPGGLLPVRDVAYPAHRMLLAGLPPATTRVVLPRTELVAAIDAVGHAEFDLHVSADGVRIGDSGISGTVDSPGASLRLGSALARRSVECALGPEVVLRLAAETQPVRVTSPYQPGFLALLMPIARTER
jgi:DNA polymerase III subunit beta